MAFSGERPGRGAGYEYDDSRHQVAYLHAATLVDGLMVVDAGSGDGQGTMVLAASASHVTGLDYHESSVAAANVGLGSSTVDFIHADLATTWPVQDADAVVAFQIIEHFDDDNGFVERALNAVKPGGKVIITTPNIVQTFSENPYHVREYRAEELRTLLTAHSDEVQLLGVFGNQRVAEFDRHRKAEVQRWLRLDPWRLRDRLPRRVVEVAFATLSTLVRRRASAAATSGRTGGQPAAQVVAGGPITVNDFEIGEGDLDACLDYFAIVTSTR